MLRPKFLPLDRTSLNFFALEESQTSPKGSTCSSTSTKNFILISIVLAVFGDNRKKIMKFRTGMHELRHYIQTQRGQVVLISGNI